MVAFLCRVCHEGVMTAVVYIRGYDLVIALAISLERSLRGSGFLGQDL